MADLNRGAGVTDAPVKPSEILDKAADVIKRNGLEAGHWYRPVGTKSPLDCPMCTGGALSVAAGFYPAYAADAEPTGAYACAIKALAERLDLAPAKDVPVRDVLLYEIAPWNDAGRTAEEVVRELRAAAASEREAGR